ncbi:MAG: succinate dehydrogenase, hydrophobic membrane anchor protein [Methylomonas sp.]|jgi:succinate dehydrogenase / fumarate reductase membrane anchor subunit
MQYKNLLALLNNIPPEISAVSHWRYQRLTAVALTPLTVWLVIFLHKALHAPYAETTAWLSSPVNALAILAWILAVIYHAALGMQVVIEDYIGPPLRNRVIKVVWLVLFSLGGIALLATLGVIF